MLYCCRLGASWLSGQLCLRRVLHRCPSAAANSSAVQGGGPVRTMNLLTWGVDLVEEQLLASAGGAAAITGLLCFSWRSAPGQRSHTCCRGHLPPSKPVLPFAPALRAAGIPSRPNVAPRPLRNIAEYSVNALRTGRLRDLDFLKPYQGRPDVLYANPLVEAGERVSRCCPLLCLPSACSGLPARRRPAPTRQVPGPGRWRSPCCAPAHPLRRPQLLGLTPPTCGTRCPPRRWCACATACPPGSASSWCRGATSTKPSSMSSRSSRRCRRPWSSNSDASSRARLTCLLGHPHAALVTLCCFFYCNFSARLSNLWFFFCQGMCACIPCFAKLTVREEAK